MSSYFDLLIYLSLALQEVSGCDALLQFQLADHALQSVSGCGALLQF